MYLHDSMRVNDRSRSETRNINTARKKPMYYNYLFGVCRLPNMPTCVPESQDGAYLAVYGVNGYTKIYAMRYRKSGKFLYITVLCNVAHTRGGRTSFIPPECRVLTLYGVSKEIQAGRHRRKWHQSINSECK